MLENLPSYIALLFIITTIITLYLFYRAIRKSSAQGVQKQAKLIAIILLVWLAVQGILTFKNVYNQSNDVLPPKIFLFGILPTIVLMILLFASQQGRKFIDSLPLEELTLVNVIRIPVEIILLCLFLHKAIPEIMTFEGWNFDILAGITAPIVLYYGFKKQSISRNVILGWNIVCLGLLLAIFVIALLSAPFPLQQFAFDQPNIGLLYFPFSWLPTFIVPIVVFGHLVSIRQLIRRKE